MVKRLRRRPLTAKTGVRVPVGLPKKRAQVKPVHAFLVLPARKANHARTKSRAEPHLPCRASVRVRAQRELCAKGASPTWGYPYLGGENHARTKSRAEPHLPCRASVRVRAQRELCAKGARPTVGGQGENHARTKSRAEPHLPCRASVRIRAQRELCAKGASPTWGYNIHEIFSVLTEKISVI